PVGGKLMRPHLVLRMLIYTTLTVVSAGFLMAQDLPSYIAPISGRTVSSPAETAMKNVLALNTSMFELYDNAHKVFESNIRGNDHSILQNNIAFMDDCLAKSAVSFAALEAFARKQAPHLKLDIEWAAQTQVAHWMKVLAEWKTMLGADWQKTYAASNTIYATRQNNVLFSVLAQFFGPQAMNDRLILIETISFTTSPDEMIDALTRIIADRADGALFFGNYYMMDYELMGSDARAAIISESAKLGIKPFLPPPVPFDSKQWPMRITPGPGPASIAELP